MRPTQYEVLLELRKEKLEKQTVTRKTKQAECHLLVTLMYLFHGISRQILAWAFRMGASTVRGRVLKTCHAVCKNNFLGFCFRHPTKLNEGKMHCVGALHGNYIQEFNVRQNGVLFSITNIQKLLQYCAFTSLR